jgi:hypothetical protein
MGVVFKCGIGKFIDGFGKTMDRYGMLVRRAVKIYYEFPDKLSLLVSSVGRFP